jgi:hypothetical protein
VRATLLLLLAATALTTAGPEPPSLPLPRLSTFATPPEATATGHKRATRPGQARSSEDPTQTCASCAGRIARSAAAVPKLTMPVDAGHPRVDYFEPVVGPQFIIDSRRERQRGRTHPRPLARRPVMRQDAAPLLVGVTTDQERPRASPRRPSG